jgi:hypothetical protein
MADIRPDAVEAMMGRDIMVASKGIIETLRERLAELEHLEATPDTHEELVDIHEFLDRLYTISFEHASNALH